MNAQSKSSHDISHALAEENELAALDEADDIGCTGRIRVAIEAIVFEGATKAEAAERSGLSMHVLRTMLAQRKYMQCLNRATEVRRTLERPRNIHRAAEIRDTSKNHPAAIAAIRFLHGENERGGVNVQVNVTTPGYVIRARHDRVIEHQSDDEDN